MESAYFEIKHVTLNKNVGFIYLSDTSAFFCVESQKFK